MDRVLRSARERAEQALWHCWAYRNDLAANEITLFLEGPQPAGEQPIFGTQIQELRTLSARFEPVRSLSEYPIVTPEGQA